MRVGTPVLVAVLLLLGCSSPALWYGGRPIILNPDGTWQYADRPPQAGKPTRDKPARRASVKGKAGFYTLWFDDAKWRIQPTHTNPDTEFEFDHRLGDRYAQIYAERIEIPVPALKRRIVEGLKSKGYDALVTLENTRRVNGSEILCLEIEGAIDGVPMKSIHYLWSGGKGTLQVVAYTGRNLFEEFRPDLTQFLNGLVVEGGNLE